jgi:ATP-binding cassette, subfamily B, bacterial
MNQFKKIIFFAKPYWKQFVVIILFMFFFAGLNQVEPFINRFVVDSVSAFLEKGETTSFIAVLSEKVGLFLLALLGVRFLRRLIRRAIDYFTNLFAYRFRFSLKEEGFDHLMKLSVSFYDQAVSGEIMSKLERGTTQITQIVNNSSLYFIPSLLTAFIGIGVVTSIYWPIALWMVLMFIPFTLISLWRFKRNQALEKKEYQFYDTQYGHFWEAISSIRLIKSFLAQNFELRKLKEFNTQILNLRKKIEKNWNISIIGDLLLEAWVWSVYVWAVLLSFQGKFSLGTMVLLINYVDIIRWPLWDLNWFFWEAKRAQIGAKDYFKILQVNPDIKNIKNPKKLKHVKGKVEFKNVSFSYNLKSPVTGSDQQSREVLKNINLTIKSGKSVAFVGPSGSGKTTVVSLISRFYDPAQGRILVDGENIKKVKLRDLRRNIGWVTQEPYLFADTIEENLKYGNPRASQEDIERACKIAHCHEFITRLPQKYQTKIGEKGTQLSGGQKQRVALARVILKNPPILILDEATSSLDSVSELYIQQALEQLTKERTTIIIAHRLSTAQSADKIFVLDKGELVEEGSHKALLSKKGLYASLYKIQAGETKRLISWGLVE